MVKQQNGEERKGEHEAEAASTVGQECKHSQYEGVDDKEADLVGGVGDMEQHVGNKHHV